MDDEHDDGDGGEEERRETPPPVSRLGRAGDRRFRSVTRARDRFRQRDRYQRFRTQLPIEELIGRLIKLHGLTDEVRQQAVCIYWTEIIGERYAARTFPASFADGVLQVSASNSSWVHEMRFFAAEFVTKINDWVDRHRVWLGPPPLVTDVRFILGTRQREALVDREHARRLLAYHSRRVKARPRADVPIVSEEDRAAILNETSAIDDPDVRAVVESVRTKWNR